MKNLILLLFFSTAFVNAQITKQDKFLELSATDYESLKVFLASKNIEVKDTIFIKYDFNGESCWNGLDGRNDQQIIAVMKRFQKKISDFNNNHKDAIALNFREPGRRVNKLKMLDNTIVIDDELFLKKLIFRKKKECGNSAIIFDDGSYILRFSDPHFDLLPEGSENAGF
jgi:hypothetical protein